MKEEARKLLEKAERALEAAQRLHRDGDYESAAGRVYYVMFHAAQALLRQQDLRYRKHAGVHGAFGEHFAKTGLLMSSTTVTCWMPSMIAFARITRLTASQGWGVALRAYSTVSG
jgi:uncharacterized protein (UPF0332 family)